MMRATVLILIFALGSGIARAEDLAATTGTGAASGIMVNSSISLNLPLLAADPAARQAEEEGHRRDLYQRTIRECAVLLDSIASSCTITSVSVSTQVNSNPGQADYLYATANIAMQVALK